MDDRRFDTLTRVFARPTSRRRTLAGLVTAAMLPLAADAQPKPNAPQPAACLPVGKRCSQKASAGASHGHGKGKHHPPSCSKCCSRYGSAGPDGKPRCACKGEGEACANPSQCCGGLCKNGQCTKCPDDLTACNGNCVDLQTNDQHCGACTTACASGQRCVAGTCVCDGTSCPRGCCAQNGTCQRGTSDQACGIGGAECRTCGTCTECDGTQCAAQSGVCCGAAAVCQNGACQDCAKGQRCKGGACVCDATSCPDGCCNGTTCVLFEQQTKQQCGTGGAACATCTGYDTCGGGGTGGVCGCTPRTTCPNGQTCGTANDACGGTLTCTGCAGCCDGNTCNPGTSNTACGKNGAPCRACTGHDTCGGGNPGTPGVCGCTRQCAGKCNGEPDGCGGTCSCPTGTRCAGGTCVAGQGTCSTGANTCSTGSPIVCNGSKACYCYASTEGDTYCGTTTTFPTSCGDCRSSQDCADRYWYIPGVFCVKHVSGPCCNGDAGFCSAPCPTS